MEFRQVMLAGVGNDENDDCRFIEILSDLERTGYVRSRRTAAETALGAGKLACEVKGFTIRDINDLIDRGHIGIPRRVRLPDALNEIRRRLRNVSRILVGLEDRTVRVGADHADVRILFLQITSRTADRAASSDARDKMRDRALSIASD